MKTVAVEASTFAPKLKRVLKSYQVAASTSISGPNECPLLSPSSSSNSSCSSSSFDVSSSPRFSLPKPTISNSNNLKPQLTTSSKLSSPTNPDGLHNKVLLIVPSDDSRGDFCITCLDGESIGCFVVGGEKRLCLPQILNSLLKNFTLHEINAVCNDLQIYYSRCTPDQLDLLKRKSIIPANAPSCGLITNTDSERLVASLVDTKIPLSHLVTPFTKNNHRYESQSTIHAVRVYHECFGSCLGLYRPSLYLKPDSPCIQCIECSRLLIPRKFVRHSHKVRHIRTCHWGFDSANWRNYILLAPEDKITNSLNRGPSSKICCSSTSPIETVFNEMKLRFVKQEPPRLSSTNASTAKSSQVTAQENELDSSPMPKKSKLEESPSVFVPTFNPSTIGLPFYPFPPYTWSHSPNSPDVFSPYSLSKKAYEVFICPDNKCNDATEHHLQAKSSPFYLCDSLTAGLTNLLSNHHVEPNLKDKIMSEVTNIIDQVHSSFLPNSNYTNELSMALHPTPYKVAQFGRIA